MTPQQAIHNAWEKSSEYAEMYEEPFEVLVQTLASEVSKLTHHIEYLESRLEHDRTKYIRWD